MKSQESNLYNTYFDSNAYTHLDSQIRERMYSKVFVLVDENTDRDCLPIFFEKISKEIDYQLIKVPSGEKYKNIDSCVFIWKKLSQEGADRKSLLINLGGGVITDMGGFVALTFKRGLDYINVPTSLLAMVDASIGGKTGVDLEGLKNQIGVISLPKMILIDIDYLKTLSEREKSSGVAEIIKHGIIGGADIWRNIKKGNILKETHLRRIIEDSVVFKNKIVSQDLEEKNLRKILNFGHTLGHAIETYFLNHPKKRALTHGESIAIGMIMESYISCSLTGLSKQVFDDVCKLISGYFQKVSVDKEDMEKIIPLLKHDKKNAYGEVKFVLLEDIGKPVVDISVSNDLIINSFEYYINKD